MTRSDTLLERMMTLHPKIIDLTLDRMWRILAALDHPERRIPPVVHIAGTNGKGSTLAMIRAGLEGAGLKTHAYTSPHLVRFHERIRLAGALIEEEVLSTILDDCLAANGPDAITYFEITTAAAFPGLCHLAGRFHLVRDGSGRSAGRHECGRTARLDRDHAGRSRPSAIPRRHAGGHRWREGGHPQTRGSLCRRTPKGRRPRRDRAAGRTAGRTAFRAGPALACRNGTGAAGVSGRNRAFGPAVARARLGPIRSRTRGLH